MKRSVLIVSFLVAFVPLMAFGEAGKVYKTNETVPWSAGLSWPCMSEYAWMEGTLHIIDSLTISSKETYRYYVHWNMQETTGYGSVSGASYVLSDSGKMVTSGKFGDNLNASYQYVDNAILTNMDTGEQFGVSYLVKLQLNANGETTVVIDDFEVICPLP